ncbi:MAG: hypothetical protein JNL23_00205 [Chitinophagaceae bacterium]|nr:hypothetical protein [Chitinophagaceae bacterium]
MLSFTPEDLLLYIYKETSPEKTAAVEEALKNDWTLREKLEVLRSSVERLDRITESPRTEVVLNILNYARQKTTQEA